MAFILVFPVAAISNEVDISLRREAPVYTGPSQEGDMEELTVEDFENFGLEDDAINTSYTGNRWPWGVLGAPVPYRLRIVDRDLSLDDFLGDDVPEELAEARYAGYLTMTPATFDGRTIHCVYVYHRPLSPKVSDSSTYNNQY